MSPKTDRALERVTALAYRLAAGLAGEELPPDGRVETEPAAGLTIAMFLFLLSITPDDLHALFFAEGSMQQIAFRPPPEHLLPPLFADPAAIAPCPDGRH